jgi:hypothetical protein
MGESSDHLCQAHLLAAFNIQDAVFQPLLALWNAFSTAYAKALNPNRIPVDIAEKNRMRKIFEKELRNFIKAFLEYSPFVSDFERNEMRLPAYTVLIGVIAMLKIWKTRRRLWIFTLIVLSPIYPLPAISFRPS